MGDFDSFETEDSKNWEVFNKSLSVPKYEDLPIYDGDVDYKDLNALSWSRLCRFVTNPYYYRKNPDWKVDSGGFTLGTYIHRMILEPKKYMDVYEEFVPPINERTGQPYKSGKVYDEAMEDFLASGKIPYTQEMYDTFCEIVYSMRDYNITEFRGSKPEVPIVGEFEGIKMKGKIDAYSEKHGIIDLKTTSSTLFSFNNKSSYYWKCNDYGYFHELAYFASIIESATGVVPPCKIIAVQTTEPYQVGVFDISEKLINQNIEQIRSEYLPMWKRYLNNENLDWKIEGIF